VGCKIGVIRAAADAAGPDILTNVLFLLISDKLFMISKIVIVLKDKRV